MTYDHAWAKKLSCLVCLAQAITQFITLTPLRSVCRAQCIKSTTFSLSCSVYQP